MVGKEALNVYPHPILQCCKWEQQSVMRRKLSFLPFVWYLKFCCWWDGLYMAEQRTVSKEYSLAEVTKVTETEIEA